MRYSRSQYTLHIMYSLLNVSALSCRNIKFKISWVQNKINEQLTLTPVIKFKILKF
jgi:hypothetical protein